MWGLDPTTPRPSERRFKGEKQRGNVDVGARSRVPMLCGLKIKSMENVSVVQGIRTWVPLPKFRIDT